MKIQRINILIPSNLNTHRKYLYNEMLDLMNQYKFGGEFKNEHIKLNSAPDVILKILEDLKIKFERIAK